MKAKVIVLGTGDATFRFIIENQDSKYIDIIGVILDDSVDERDRNLFANRINTGLKDNIPIFMLTDECLKKADLIFSPEYRRIIPAYYCNHYIFVNCHAGILPKWRGFSANAWALMNGEKEIGYSIHRVRPGIDDGEVFYVKHISIQDNQTYGDVHKDMIDSIVTDVPKLLFEISAGKIQPIIQPSKGFAYCNRFTKSMGDITGFEKDSRYYVNLYRCMSKPLGSGLWFVFNGEEYSVDKIEHGNDYGVINYMGIPGKVVNIVDNQLWVKTLDNVVVLSGVKRKNEPICLISVFKNGNHIGN